jgi:hypothetical protein
VVNRSRIFHSEFSSHAADLPTSSSTVNTTILGTDPFTTGVGPGIVTFTFASAFFV